MSASQDKKKRPTGQYDAYLKLALSPLLPLVDRFLEKPVDTFTAKLPNLIYESDTVFEAVRTVARSIGFGLEDMVSNAHLLPIH